jgi:hypothetical protein
MTEVVVRGRSLRREGGIPSWFRPARARARGPPPVAPADGGEEIRNPAGPSLTATMEFTVRREAVFTRIDPAQAGPITDSHRILYAEELRRDAPHMAVTPAVAAMADRACGDETNIAAQARLLLGAVADYADHYSKDPSKPHCGIGDAEDCLTNAGKEVDPGYRCWAEYFVPNYGWVSADIVEADDPNGYGRTRWFTGLTERRLWLNEGREFDLAGRTVTHKRVNTMIIGYAEIDGVEARVLPDEERGLEAQLSRTVHYTEVAPAEESVAVATAH